MFVFGSIVGMVIDTLWWNIDYKKAEKGFEVIEHYHLGIVSIIAGVVLGVYFPLFYGFFLGLGLLFIIAEWRQFIEIHNNKVIPGKPFAYGSVHFKQSTLIGIGLFVVLILLIIYHKVL